MQSIVFGKFSCEYMSLVEGRYMTIWEPLLCREVVPTLEIRLRLPEVTSALKVISRPITSTDEHSCSCEATHSLTNETKTDIEIDVDYFHACYE